MGFQPVVLSKSLKNAAALPYYARLLMSWKRADMFLTIYPYFCYPTFGSNPLRRIDERLMRYLHTSANGVGSVLYVVDLPIEQILAVQRQALVDKKAYQIERQVFRSFDILCVFNEQMKKFINERYDISKDKFVEFGVLDHSATFAPLETDPHTGRWRIAYAGDWDRIRVGDWAKELPQTSTICYEFMGKNWGCVFALGRADIVYRGSINDDDSLLRYISANADFGIIEMPPLTKRYSNYGSTSKFGAYVAAGVPILVSSGCTYIASLVTKYGIGLVFNSLSDIPLLTQDLSASLYADMRKHCLELGRKLRTGYFFKRAIAESLHKLGLP